MISVNEISLNESEGILVSLGINCNWGAIYSGSVFIHFESKC